MIVNASPVPVSLDSGRVLAPGEYADVEALTGSEEDLVASGALRVLAPANRKTKPAAQVGSEGSK